MNGQKSDQKLVIIAGAGATLSDASSKAPKLKPPLDGGFFSACEAAGTHEQLPTIKGYLNDFYEIDPTDPTYDSLERIMAVIYADINSSALGLRALEAFRAVIRIFNRRIAETTNSLRVTNRGGLYRIISRKLMEGYSPENITIVTLNQDIQIEKTLAKLQQTKKYAKYGPIWSFPHCYMIKNANSRLSEPPENQSRFEVDEEDKGGISVLKLHGSLNWFSWHKSSAVPKESVLSRKKRFKITPRRNIPTQMMVKMGDTRMHTFPLIIPPVNNKAAIIHDDMQPIWAAAEKRMIAANEIIVFGYSCPATDFESANLLRRATRPSNKPSAFSVIDPSYEAFTRYIQVTALDRLSYFRSCDSFVEL